MGQTEEVSTLNDDENKAGTAKTASKIDLGWVDGLFGWEHLADKRTCIIAQRRREIPLAADIGKKQLIVWSSIKLKNRPYQGGNNDCSVVI